jgi:hypothetical protein
MANFLLGAHSQAYYGGSLSTVEKWRLPTEPFNTREREREREFVSN